MEVLKGGEYYYKKTDYLGGGIYGTVYKGTRIQNGHVLAIKVISKKKIEDYGDYLIKAIANEIKTLTTVTKLKNPYIIEIFDNFEDENYIYIVTEYCDSETLQQTLKKNKLPNQEECQRIMFQIILGLSTLSDKGIVHRDLKPDNIFINQNVYKIGDFGFAREIKGLFYSDLGTWIYRGPEFYTDQPQTSKVDVWACGCMLHQLFFGSKPFQGESKKDYSNAVVKGYVKPPKKLPADIEDLLMGMLKYDVEQRYSIDELRMHKAFDFCRNQFASRLDRTLFVSLFGIRPESNLIKQHVNKFDSENMEVLNQIHFITKCLCKYRDFCKFYLRITEWLLKNAPDEDVTIFLMAKRTIQKLSVLDDYIRNEIFQNNSELTIENCTQDAWEYFLCSDDYTKMTGIIIKDKLESRKLFEKAQEKATVTFSTYSKTICDMLNDNTNVHHDKILGDYIKCAAKHLFKKALITENSPLNDKRFDMCLYLCILQGFEKKINNEQTYQLSDFVKQVEKFSIEEKSELIKKFLGKQ